MLKSDKRVRIITGHYGSGKTEFAVNYAIALNALGGKKVALADMDIINVYFRSRERRKLFEKLGIKIISSTVLGNNVDLPAISAEVITPVKDKSYDYIIDLGGNDVGTTVLSMMKPFIDSSETDFFMVINTYRPETSDVDGIMRHKLSLEKASGLKITGLINNTNLLRETTAADIEKGDMLIRKVSELTGVPIRYTSYVKEAANKAPESVSGEIFEMDFYMREVWI